MRNLVLLAHPKPAATAPLRKKLEGTGYKTLTAATGSEAMAAVMQYKPQLVVAYPELPELEASEVCLRLKQDPETESMGFVLIARPSDGDKFVGAQVGADALIVEPVDDEVLSARIAELFRNLQLNAKSLARLVR